MRQPALFVLVGGAGLLVNLGLFASLVHIGVPYIAASVAAYLVSNALMYLGNRFVTFRLGLDGFWGAYLRYLAVGLVVVALNAAVLAFLVEIVSLPETPAQALSLLVVTPVAFVLFKRWTFRL